MLDNHMLEALDCLVRNELCLRRDHHLPWSPQAAQGAAALRFIAALSAERPSAHVGGASAQDPTGDGAHGPVLAAIVGGASSGKSTVFNNLLGGRLASRVTARGHSTLGPILAVHELVREDADTWLEAERLLPGFAVRRAGVDDSVAGETASVCVIHHAVDRLREVLLFDMPDNTSELARIEGDLSLNLLPWFDRLIVLVDHERWFDRQLLGRLRAESEQFGQDRLVIFNRAREGRLEDRDCATLRRQAERFGTADPLILEFRQGRGCRIFPPGTFDRVIDQLRRPAPDRRAALRRYVARCAQQAANQNAERRARLAPLRRQLDQVVQSVVPTEAQCIAALLTSDECRHLDVVARTLRIAETRQWLARQNERLRKAVAQRVPLFGGWIGRGALVMANSASDEVAEADNRPAVAWEVFRSRGRRLCAEIDEAARGSEFWGEVRSWTETDGPSSVFAHIDAYQDRVSASAAALDAAIERWTAHVESECRGLSPHLFGAAGAAAVAGAIVLATVAGPIGALTWPAATGALSSALGVLAGSAGVGALAGKPLTRLLHVVREQLLGSPEFEAVRSGIGGYRQLMIEFGESLADESYRQAMRWVLPAGHEVVAALETLCNEA